MTPAERQLIANLFDRLATLEDAQRDPDAERAIKDGLRQAPNAVYALVQTALLQEEALKQARRPHPAAGAGWRGRRARHARAVFSAWVTDRSGGRTTGAAPSRMSPMSPMSLMPAMSPRRGPPTRPWALREAFRRPRNQCRLRSHKLAADPSSAPQRRRPPAPSVARC